MIEQFKQWLQRLWHSTESSFGAQPASQPILTWRFWLGVITTASVVLYIELSRRAGIVVPVPFLILYGSVVLAANVAGLLVGLISAAIATAFITYAASISFGPTVLTGGPVQVVLGALLHLVTAFFLGRTKSQNRVLIQRQTSLEKLVEVQISKWMEANQSLQLEVTEHRQTLDALKQSVTQIEQIKQEWEATADSLPELVCLLDYQTHIIRTNRTVERWGLRSVSTVRGITMHDLLHPECSDLACYQKDFWPQAWAEIKQNRLAELVVLDELLKRHLHLQVRPIESESRRHHKADDSFAIVIIHDITQRKKAEEALRRSEERFSTAFHLNPSAIAISSLEEGRYLDVNQSFLKVFGYRREEVVGHTSAELNLWVSAGDRARIVQSLNEQGRIHNEEIPFRISSGEIRLALVSLEIIELDPEPYILSMFLDITERKRLEEQLRQTQKMEAIGQLTAGIAHDFNNLLLVINGFAELMRVDLTANDPHQESLMRILHSGRRASDLVHQLLTFSRKQIIEPRLLDINSIVLEMNKMLQRIIDVNIEFETKLESDIWLIKADPTQIEQIIINLAINARDAMPDGGCLTIETSKVILDDDYVAHHLETQPGEHVLLTVSDTGHGMSEEIKSRIFDPFFTTKEPGKGTGLGLATVYGIVKQNRGNVWVYTEEGNGTTFKIYLPRANEIAPQLKPSVEEEVNIVVGTETILLVEDNAAVRHLIGEVLVAQGYTLLEAQDGSEAITMAAQHSDTIHLLLTDIIMPDMNGTAIAEELVRGRSGLKVLFMSGYADSVVKDQNMLNPDTNLLQKPFSPTALTRKVREILDN